MYKAGPIQGFPNAMRCIRRDFPDGLFRLTATVTAMAVYGESGPGPAACKACGKAEPFLDPAQHQHATGGRQPGAVETGAQFPGFDR